MKTRSRGDRRLRRSLITLLAGVSLVHVAACLISIRTEALWPVRLVAREITPWFVVLNLAGVGLSWRRTRIAQVVFVGGLVLAIWPLAQLWIVGRDLRAQWRAQGFREEPAVAGPVDAAVQAFRGTALPDIVPEPVAPSIHLYRQAKNRGHIPLPVIVDVHGGSWEAGGVDEDAAFAQAMAARGFAVFTVDYRKAPAFTFPAHLEDVRNAVEWVRENAGRFGADPERIVLVGRSAGGHLAMLAGYQTPASTFIRGIVSYYGPADPAALHAGVSPSAPIDVQGKLEAFLGGTPSAIPAAYRRASPADLVRAGLPPTLHIQGGSDNIVPAQLTRQMHLRTLAAGSRSLLLELPWADHSFDFVYFGPSNAVAQSAVEAFLREVLR